MSISERDILFGIYVKKKRDVTGLSREKFADNVGVTEQTLADIEKGKRTSRNSTKKKILDYLGVTFDDFERFCSAYKKSAPLISQKEKYISHQKLGDSNIFWCRNVETACRICWDILLKGLENVSQPSIVLPTGRTASVFLDFLKDTKGNLSKDVLLGSQFFIDTETFGVSKEHPTSRHRFVLNTLKKMLPELDSSNVHFFNGVFSPGLELENYDALLRDFPPTTHVLTFSPNGEFIGYEPDGMYDHEMLPYQKCCIHHLSDRAKFYIEPNQPSLAIISIGMQNVLSAKQLLLLVLHKEKAEALKRFLFDPIEVSFPVSLLRTHPNIKVISTAEIAKEIGYKCSRIF